MEKIIKLELPNILGSEKVAIEKAVSIAKKMGFRQDRIDDLKTAMAEACINAIEHGNKFDKNTKVGITVAADDTKLEVVVHDTGTGIDPEKIPKKRVGENGFPKRRGYGVFLISNLVNEFSFEAQPGEGNKVKMMMHLNK